MYVNGLIYPRKTILSARRATVWVLRDFMSAAFKASNFSEPSSRYPRELVFVHDQVCTVKEQLRRGLSWYALLLLAHSSLFQTRTSNKVVVWIVRLTYAGPLPVPILCDKLYGRPCRAMIKPQPTMCKRVQCILRGTSHPVYLSLYAPRCSGDIGVVQQITQPVDHTMSLMPCSPSQLSAYPLQSLV